ncbi:Acyl-ACP thioesterase [Peptoniphilus harei]|uniref:acyl-[acyl-carrier-protein] thioesterase n=1 Tax=Peptoniphilus harei TaxID=54005 RepID=UPI000F6D8081|nr:acyl-ACP thioesterase domain-containing protein [Peptoniphilus harei]MDU3086333.1 thioesterase [Peptoniphilus harei]QQE47196.1 acyl-[acyl-carrier-protein] thioesterase [Peptoniphilus harei]VEJ34353.1 Acyl-ACP thioesterase [Peptoniphilus harei]
MKIFCKEYEVMDFLSSQSELKLNHLVSYLIETSNYQSIDLGLDNKKLLDMGYTWMIYKWKIKIKRYPRSHEKIKIKTWASGFRNINAFREFEIYCGGEKILEASAIFLLIDLENRKPIKIPEEIAEVYGSNDNRIFKSIKRINEPEDLERLDRFSYKILKRDLDFNNHVNNSVYLELIYEAMDKDLSQVKFKEISVNYINELKLGDEIIIDSYREGDRFYFFFKSKDKGQIYARICALSQSSN